MTANLRGVVWRLAIFMALAVVAATATAVIFGQFRFGGGKSYSAEFTNVTGLRKGQMVRIAGVEVGKVQDIVVKPDSTVRVTFAADPSVVLTEGTRAQIRYDDLIGGRYLALEEGVGDARILNPGQTIPVSRTAPALDLDSVTGGFRPLFRALDPDQVNALSGQLMSVLQGQGGTISSFLNQAAAVTNTLADRDLLIGEVIDNLNVVMGSFGGQSDQLDKAVTSLAELTHGLADRRVEVTNAVAYTNAAAGSIADLLSQGREPFQKVVGETDRTAEILMEDRDDIDALLNVLPDKYRAINRQALNGGYFSFYFCDVVLKLNGKGGQPVYTKVVGQSTGRCAPK